MRPSWFRTVTHPRGRLVATVAAIVLFVAGIVAGALLPDYRMWIQVPAAVALMTWYAAMARMHRRANRSHDGPERSFE